MKNKPSLTTLFIDIGGVLLTNGWDHNSRQKACQKFKIDFSEMDSRHRTTFEVFENGKICLDEYLNRIVFYKKRLFSNEDFKDFIFSESKPFPEMLSLIQELKIKHKLKIVVVSNEARELNDHRIKRFQLNSFVDFFISSCYVGLRKPDQDIYRLALDTAQVPKEQILYIDDRLMFIEVAKNLGIPSLQHIDYQTTSKKLASFFKI